MRLALLGFAGLAGLAACSDAARHPRSWAAGDPNRPVMMAGAPADARRLEAAARECGLQRVERVRRGDLDWIILHELTVSSPDGDERYRCTLAWAAAHPEARLYFFGNELAQ